MSSETQIHDVSTGFKDIKPIPEFSLSGAYTLGVTTILFLVLFLYGLWKVFKRTKAPQIVPEISAHILATEGITELDAKRKKGLISTKEYCSSVSLCMRKYFDSSLSIPADDLTLFELRQRLPLAIERQLSFAPHNYKTSLKERILTALSYLETVTYAHATQSNNFERELSSVSGELSQIIREIHFLKGEEQRKLEALMRAEQSKANQEESNT